VAKDSRFSFRLPVEVHDALRRAAEAEDRSVANLVLKILTDWLRRHKWLKVKK
jgi:hypothetical protein